MTKRIKKLESDLEKLYEESGKELLFHGWHHIQFVRNKAAFFSEDIGAETELVEAVALTHDLNYFVDVSSGPEAGAEIRKKYLIDSNFSPQEVEEIENIILKTHTADRTGEVLSANAQAFADADMLFKGLPITPILFASKYIEQNKVDIDELAKKVTDEQIPLMEQNIYFHTAIAREMYMKWAKTNLELWSNVRGALKDKDVQDLIDTARELGVI